MQTYKYKKACVERYLSDVGRTKQRLEQILDAITETREQITSISGLCYDQEIKSPNAYRDGIPDSIIKLQEIEARYKQEYDAISAERIRALRLCDSKNVGRYYLWLQHVKTLTVMQIAYKEGVSVRTVDKYKAEAIEGLYKELPISYQ